MTEPDFDNFDTHLALAYKYLTMAHEQVAKLVALRSEGVEAWAELDGFSVHDKCGLAHGWAEHATSALARLEYLTKRPLRETDDSRG